MKHYICCLLALLSCGAFSGCSDFLEEQSQDKYYISSYADLDELLIGDCYLRTKASQPLASSPDIGYFLPYICDEIEEQNGTFSQTFDDHESIFGYFTWQDRVGATEDDSGFKSENGTWKETYRLINVANNIINEVPKIPQATAQEKAGALRVNGEAHFLRALYYFWLVNLYAKPYQPSSARTDLGVPIKVFPEVKDQRFRRNTVQEVYDQILADLQVAESSLNQSEPRKTIYRADSTAVNLLLSRVYLYMQRWEDASRYADKVLRAPHTQLENLNTAEEAFLRKDNPEVLFSMGGSDVTCTMCNSWKSFRVSHDLYQTYADEDLRKTQWWWTYEDFVGDIKPKMPNKTTVETTSQEYYYYGYNWASNGALAEVSDRFLFRTAEAYLNKAEAEAYLGHDGIARDIINRLRMNRYQTGSDYQLTESGDKLIEAIRDERRRELALEGHRWFDLRRYAVCAVHPQSKEIVHEYTLFESRNSTTMTERRRYVLKANDPAYTLPIPNEVLEFNTGMQNNEHPRRDYTLIPIH